MSRMPAFALIGLALASPAPAQRTLVVPTQYGTITAAIAAANNGDTVLVEPGLYRERIDFTGKTIRVMSRGGATVTTIHPPSPTGFPATVTFKNGEGPTAILEGFTITGSTFRGVNIYQSSPTLRSCHIRGNKQVSTGDQWSSAIADGAGLGCWYSSARLVDCEIRDNTVTASKTWGMGDARAYGAGLETYQCSLVVDRCLIAGNRASASCPIYSSAGAYGGGMQLSGGSSTFVHCLVTGNSVSSTFALGAAIVAGSGTRFLHCNVTDNRALSQILVTKSAVDGGTFVNCIVRRNTPAKDQFSGSASYSNVEGGAPGTGNFDANPRFRDSDFHLDWDSPCRNKGTNAVTGLPPTDWEGDPRKAEGTADVGRDEFFARLKITGSPSPGGAVDIAIFGQPGHRTYWAFSEGSSHAPATIPGLEGWFVLDPTAFALIDLGFLPSRGSLSFRFAFAPTFPRITVSVQALVGKQMSNRVVLDVK